MPDSMLRDLADLTADVLAVLEDQTLRGVTVEVQGEPSPPAVKAAPVAEAGPPPSAPVVSGAWATLASEGRQAGEAPRLATTGLEQVRQELGDCRRCGLCTGRRNIVFGVGDANADLMVIGEGPGEREDARGEPFVGPAGQMLDRMLLNVLGLPRSSVYISNVVKCRPPQNRNPAPDEVDMCRPYLDKQIDAIGPKLVLVLGGVALGALFGVKGITRHRGQWFDYRGVPALTTFHPAYLLRQPAGKRPVFEDLKVLRDRYNEVGGRR